jgi:hypothetical protein
MGLLGLYYLRHVGFRFVMGVPPNSSKSFDHDLDGEEILRDSHRGLSENGLDTLIPSINCNFNGNHVD